MRYEMKLPRMFDQGTHRDSRLQFRPTSERNIFLQAAVNSLLAKLYARLGSSLRGPTSNLGVLASIGWASYNANKNDFVNGSMKND
jgi:hypothetical protein